ncbi:MAG: PHP domain-containing protein [Pseudomonadota bacterium]
MYIREHSATMRFDLHVHTTISPCSVLTLEEILNHARARGLDGVCITDHDTMDVRHLIREGPQPTGLCVIFGIEYTTNDGDFLLFGPFDKVPPGLQAPEVLRWIDAVGGVAVAAHPFRRGRQTQEYLIQEGLCRIVEGLNGRNRESENDRLNRWRKRYSVHEVGGSDAHSLAELGKVLTSFSEPVRSRQGLVAALKKGRYVPERGNGDHSLL